MPEQISKYPEVTLEVLKSAGARCGEGVPKKILTKCPSERFCALPGGEVCVYGLEQIPQMTQISMKELAATVCVPAQRSSTSGDEAFAASDLVPWAAVFALGLAAGSLRWRRGGG